jgi:hypothetical protein
MPSGTTLHYGLDFLDELAAAGDPDAIAKVNRAMRWLKWLKGGGPIKNIGGNTPAGSPADLQAHVIGSSPTGAWASNAGDYAMWVDADSAWDFLSIPAGQIMRVTDDSNWQKFNGTSWSTATL